MVIGPEIGGSESGPEGEGEFAMPWGGGSEDWNQVADRVAGPTEVQEQVDGFVCQIEISHSGREGESLHLYTVETAGCLGLPFHGEIDESVQATSEVGRFEGYRHRVVHVVGPEQFQFHGGVCRADVGNQAGEVVAEAVPEKYRVGTAVHGRVVIRRGKDVEGPPEFGVGRCEGFVIIEGHAGRSREEPPQEFAELERWRQPGGSLERGDVPVDRFLVGEHAAVADGAVRGGERPEACCGEDRGSGNIRVAGYEGGRGMNEFHRAGRSYFERAGSTESEVVGVPVARGPVEGRVDGGIHHPGSVVAGLGRHCDGGDSRGGGCGYRYGYRVCRCRGAAIDA